MASWNMIFGLERVFRLALLRFTSHGRYAAVRCLGEISELIALSTHSRNNQVLRQVDANIYTHMQSLFKGKSKTHRRSLLAGVESIFFGCKAVLGSLNNLRGAPGAYRGIINSLMGMMSGLLTCLEMQLLAGSDEKSSALRERLLAEGSAVRRTIINARLAALCAQDTGHRSSNVNNFTTALADFEKWVQAVEGMSARAVRRHSHRTGVRQGG